MKPEELKVESYDPSPTGGMKPVKLVAGVKVTHLSTGNIVCCVSERTMHKNRQLAIEALEWLAARQKGVE